MKPELVIGLDVGTTATKCLITDLQGQVVSESRSDYRLSYPQPGWVEQEPEALWQAVVGAVAGATEKAGDAGRFAALSLSCQGGTLIPAGDDGQPLRPAISWLDTRAREHGRQLLRAIGADNLYRVTGWGVTFWSALLLIPWLFEYERQTYEKASHYLFVNDFILHRLTGVFCMDPSDAAMTVLYDIAAGRWSDMLCEAAGIRREQLSPIIPSGQLAGRLKPEWAAPLGLPAGLPVINGGHDQYCGALGAGVVESGDILLSSGTAWVLLAAAARPLWDPQHTFSPGPHVLPDHWGLISSLPTAGAGMDWLARTMLADPAGGKPRYDLLDRELSNVEPGARGLLFLPLFSGHESATGGSEVRATLTGLTLAHSRWDVAQSLMEGVACELRWVLDSLEALGYTPRSLVMVGGASRSQIWPQIVSDVAGLPVAQSELVEAAAYGAARLAAIGLGASATSKLEAPHAWQAPTHTRRPDPARALLYERLLAQFKETYATLQQLARGSQ